MRDMTEAQYQEALRRHRIRVSNSGSLVVHVTDEEINHSFGWMFSTFMQQRRRARLARLLRSRDEELARRAAVAKAREKKRRDVAATLGIDADTGAPLA